LCVFAASVNELPHDEVVDKADDKADVALAAVGAGEDAA
jgi:hypothetical protein